MNVPGEGVLDPDPSVPNAVSYSGLVMNGNGSAQLSGTATSVGGSAPTLTASATADGGASFQIDANVDVLYYFAVSGPASATPIPIRITYSGVGTAAGSVADGVGRIQVDRLSPQTNLIYDILGISSVFGPPTDSFGDTVFASADVDSIYSVMLHTEAHAQAAGGVSQADVSIDPSIEIDPTFGNAGLYDIVYSANIGVPEPAAWSLGVAAVATAALRRAWKHARRPE